MRSKYLRYIQEHHLLLSFSHVWGSGVEAKNPKSTLLSREIENKPWSKFYLSITSWEMATYRITSVRDIWSWYWIPCKLLEGFQSSVLFQSVHAWSHSNKYCSHRGPLFTCLDSSRIYQAEASEGYMTHCSAGPIPTQDQSHPENVRVTSSGFTSFAKALERSGCVWSSACGAWGVSMKAVDGV